MFCKGRARQQVAEQMDVDTDRLYGSIDDAIAYLKEIKAKYGHYQNFGIQEHWSGYEDMELLFTYFRDETDEEYNKRLREEGAYKRKKKEEEERQKKLAEDREKDREEFLRLKSKHGF